MTNNIQKVTPSISRAAHKSLFEDLVSAMREYAAAINTADDSKVESADVDMQAFAAEFLKPYGMQAGAAFMSMIHADIALKKNADCVRVFSVPSGATVRKYLRTEVFPRMGLVWESCVTVGEKKTRAKKENRVDFGSMSVMDIVNGMSAEKVAEFRAAFAALDARTAVSEIAAD